MNDKSFDVIIVGSGPAGLTAAIYTSRANLRTLVIAGEKWGGQLQFTSKIENYPGFPESIDGPVLMEQMRKQAEKFGADINNVDFKSGDFSSYPYKLTAGGQKYSGKTVIIAAGADTRWLGVPGEKELIGRGVSSCAVCDAFFYKNKKVAVIGGGDSAIEEALFLTRFASEVSVIHRREKLRASKIMQERAFNNPKIKFVWNTEAVEVLGESKVEGLKLKSKNKDSELIWELAVDGVFVAIGHTPNSAGFSGIKTDEKGFIKTYKKRGEGAWIYKMMTNIEGVFCAGDISDFQYKQAVSAAGAGCMAALEAEKWLENLRPGGS